MKSLTVRLPDDVHAEVVARAADELRPINGIMRRLIELWLAGDVDLTPPAPHTGKGQTLHAGIDRQEGTER